MPSLSAKLAVCAFLLGGFAFTGDIGRLADRGSSLVEKARWPIVSGPDGAAVPSATGIGSQPAGRSQGAAAASPGHSDRGRRPSTPALLPSASLETLDLRTLEAGDLVTVWAGSPPAPYQFDIVDPATGDAVVRAAGRASDQPLAPVERTRLTGDPNHPARLTLGASLQLLPLGIAHGGRSAPPESLGTIRALAVGR